MKHKCTDCGFLGNRIGLKEVSEDDRKVQGINENVLDRDSFVCLEQKRDLRKEFDEQPTGSNSSRMKGVLEGGCTDGRDWRPGFSPKEHEEMIDREHQRASDRKWHLIEIIVIAIATIGAGVMGYFLNHIIK